MISLNPCAKCGMRAYVMPTHKSGYKGFIVKCCGEPTHSGKFAKTYDGAAANWNAANPKEAEPHE